MPTLYKVGFIDNELNFITQIRKMLAAKCVNKIYQPSTLAPSTIISHQLAKNSPFFDKDFALHINSKLRVNI